MPPSEAMTIIRPIINEQIFVNIVYVVDFVIMLMIYGFKTVLLKKSYSLRAEVIFQIINITYASTYNSVYTDPPSLEESVLIQQA